MYNFLVQNWGFISTAILVLFYIILLILRKKKIIVEDSLLNGIYSYAIEMINLAENKFKSGVDKKEFVVNALKEKFPQSTKVLDEQIKASNSNYLFTKRNPSDDVFGVIVESILMTPQRKEKERG